MKTLLTALLLSSTALSFSAEFTVKLTEATTMAKGLDKLPFQVRPMGNKPSRLSFLIEGQNIVALVDKSLKIEDPKVKWEGQFFNTISDDGKYATLRIESDTVLMGQMDSYKLKGTIDLLTGEKNETKTLKLAANADATKAGPLEIRFKKSKSGKKAGFFGGGSGISVKGDHNAIKEILLISNGREIESNSWSSSMNGPRLYSFSEDLKGDEVEVKLTYWTDLTKSTITFEK